MKFKLAFILIFFGILGYTVFSAKKEFSPSETLPKEALVYAEFTDLPAFIKLLETSETKAKYLESENFDSFKKRRLGLKLASRWQEFNEAAGFSIDLETVGKLADKRAAIGIYDIGKLEFVFIAPVSSEIFTATAFFQNKERFEEKLLENGTSVFSINVAADRGRQSQKLLFADIQGQFVLATSENLLLQTVNNIKGKSDKNRLSEESSFKVLAEKSNPNLLFVWVNQTALNKDYYFKRYWLMSGKNNLKNIRAGIFNVSMENKKIVERRRFLLENAAQPTNLDGGETQEILAFAPTEISFYRLQTANANTSANAISDCIFDRKTPSANSGQRDYYSNYSFNDSDDSAQRNYEYLSRKFDEAIDEKPEINFEKPNENKNYKSNLQTVLRAANPQRVLTLVEPKYLPMPLFAEFRRAVVIQIKETVNQTQLEAAIAQMARSRVSISDEDLNLAWQTIEKNGTTWRTLNLPMLSWEICYAKQGNFLIFSNSSDFLEKILAQSKNAPEKKILNSSINSLTVVNFTNKTANFDEIFANLTDEKESDFFIDNIGSLLETFSDVKTIEIESGVYSKFQEEKITFNLE